MNVFITSEYSEDCLALGIEFLDCDNSKIIEIIEGTDKEKKKIICIIKFFRRMQTFEEK